MDGDRIGPPDLGNTHSQRNHGVNHPPTRCPAAGHLPALNSHDCHRLATYEVINLTVVTATARTTYLDRGRPWG